MNPAQDQKELSADGFSLFWTSTSLQDIPDLSSHAFVPRFADNSGIDLYPEDYTGFEDPLDSYYAPDDCFYIR